MIYVLHPGGNVKPIVVKQVFEVRDQVFHVLVIVEKETMRKSRAMRFFKAHELERIESALSLLKGAVVQVVNSDSIARIDRTVHGLVKKVAQIEDATAANVDMFKAYFDSPPLPTTLVFDFDARVNSGARITSEGRLLDAVLRPAGADGSHAASALGTHGMGGVGKTTGLKRLCHHEAVREMFSDGVFFLEFGQDTDDAKVMGELVRFVYNSGGRKIAEEMQEMRRNGKLGDAVNRAAQWVKGRNFLLVCDDLWATNGNKFGYIDELRRVLRDAPESRLLVSTRDRRIAKTDPSVS